MKIPVLGVGYLPVSSQSGTSTEVLKTVQAVAIYFGCPPQSDTTSEDTYTSTVEHREVKLEFSWDLPLC